MVHGIATAERPAIYAPADDPTGAVREIHFTPLTALQKNALRLDEPAVVEITDTGNLIEPVPAR